MEQLSIHDLIELYKTIKSIYIARGYSTIAADTHASIWTYSIKIGLIDARSIINKMLLYAQESE